MVVLIVNNGISKFRMCCYHIRPKFFGTTTHTLQAKIQLKLPQNGNNEENNIISKIVYNSVIKNKNIILERRKEILEEDEKLMKHKLQGAPVIALKYFTEDYLNETSKKIDFSTAKSLPEDINFPYKIYDRVEIDSNNDCSSISECDNETNLSSETSSPFSEIKDKSYVRPKKSWMYDYNKYNEVSVTHEEDEDQSDEEFEPTAVNYGSADPSIPTSSVPCGGCGAHLHCKDPSIPGYLPKEIFWGLQPEQLQAIVCQRCHFLRQYNTALSVTVDPSTYPQLLSTIKGERAMVLLVVDMTDFPCSIWPGILDVIGSKRPLIVVGNKVDLLQDWSNNMLGRAKRALTAQLPRNANILHTALVSAKTGFGIEDLVTALYNTWQYRGDVYLVGCTNVGKSMLFNALLQSDYCKSRAVDLIQRATTAPWPGTTLNLLKFPITRPDGYRLAIRNLRLKKESTDLLKMVQEGGSQNTPQMITRINRTFSHGNIESDKYKDDLFAMPKMEALRKIRAPGSGLDPSDPAFAQSRWLYDTPGVLTSDQIIDLLTTEELVLTLPQAPLVPRTYSLWAGQSLMVGGLGRLDYLSGTANIKMTVLAAQTLPVTICFTEAADEVYSHYLGSEALAVPCGSAERLRQWPGLRAVRDFSLKGSGWKESCGDVVLSSAGWVAVTAQKDSLVQLRPWTPEGRGAHVRIPSVLPQAVRVKGKRMFKSPAYALFNDHIKLKLKKT